MSKYICQICGYVYDEAAQIVKFDDLLADWTCPLCGATKEMFKKADETAIQTKRIAEHIKQNPVYEVEHTEKMR